MCFIASAIELMCPGVPVTACATMKPRRSKTPAERSPASRTIDVNEVRMSAAACSLTTPMRRLQQMSSVTGSIAPPPARWPSLHGRRRDHGVSWRVCRARAPASTRCRRRARAALRLGEMARGDHLPAAALDHHSPEARGAEEVGLAGPHRLDLGRDAPSKPDRLAKRGQAIGDGVVEPAARAPARKARWKRVQARRGRSTRPAWTTSSTTTRPPEAAARAIPATATAGSGIHWSMRARRVERTRVPASLSRMSPR